MEFGSESSISIYSESAYPSQWMRSRNKFVSNKLLLANITQVDIHHSRKVKFLFLRPSRPTTHKKLMNKPIIKLCTL